MYLDYYQIEKKPFQRTVDPNFLWLSDKHKEALAVLNYGLLNNSGFIMIAGDVGTGKTTLVNAFIDSLGPETLFANITDPGLKRNELYNLLGATFNFGNNFSGKGDFSIAFRVFLEKCHSEGKQVLVIIDEAQRLDRFLLEEFRLLSNIELKNTKLMNIFFVGQDELIKTLERHENRAILQRISLIYHLVPLLAEETINYIHHRLRVAGTEERIFTRNAIREIYAFSGGYPRIINTICDNAMLTGYVKQKKTIDVPEIVECSRELGLKKKSGPQSSHKGKASEVIWKDETAGSKESRSSVNFRPYIAVNVFLFILICVCFLYFPLKAGVSLSGVLPYWTGQIRGNGRAISDQVMESASPPHIPPIVQEEGEMTEPAVVEHTDINPETFNNRNADGSAFQDNFLPTPPQSVPDS